MQRHHVTLEFELKNPTSSFAEASHSAAARAEQFFSRKICVLSEVQDKKKPAAK